MRSGWVVRRWVVASAMSLLVGCGPEVLEEKHTQAPVASGVQESVGDTSTTLSGICAGSEELCNGVCTDTLSDLDNCGWCGMRCPGNVCWYGTCYRCDSNYTNCVAI